MIGSCNNIKFSVPDEPVEGVTLDLNEANKVSNLDTHSKPVEAFAATFTSCFRCHDCKKSFKSEKFLKTHRRKFHTTGVNSILPANQPPAQLSPSGSPEFRCPICSKSFLSNKSLRIHYTKGHTYVEPFKCNDCDQKFRKITRLSAHVCPRKTSGNLVKVGNELQNVVASFCRRCSLEISTDDGSNFCQVCREILSLSCEVGDPAVVHHPAVDERAKAASEVDMSLLSCQFCEEKFELMPDLKIHLRASHNFEGKVKPFLCPFCDKRFSMKLSLRQHAAAHSAEPSAPSSTSTKMLTAAAPRTHSGIKTIKIFFAVTY